MIDRKRLASPMNRLFDNRQPERRVQRLWQGIKRARVKRGSSPALVGGLVIAAALLSALAMWALRPSPAGALRLAGGQEVPPSLSPQAPARVFFDDGSQIDLRARAHLDVLESTARVFGLALRDGASEFEVHPGGPRTWRIECDGVTVEVVGTHFVLERSPATLRVGVTRGAVVVRGAHVPDGVVRLGAGQSISVALTDVIARGATSSNAPRTDTLAPATRAEQSTPPKQGGATTVATPTPTPGAAISTNPVATAPTLEALMTDADAARRDGRFRDAAALLERAVSQGAGEPNTPLAEFSLGRLYLERLSEPGRAATHFSRALSGHLPAVLAEDARARLVEAYARGGNPSLAIDAAAQYRALYPAGRRLADVNRWAPSARLH